MYQLAIQRDFIARHRLVGGQWGAENELHSHHYRVEIVAEGSELDEHGYLLDIVELRRAVDEVIGGVAERTLNEVPEFAGINPSLENFSRIFLDRLASSLEPLTSNPVRRQIELTVRLWENEHDWAACRR